MFRWMRKHITPSVVISLIALTLSLMGAGYAAITLPRDSVGTAQIRAGAVGSAEIANGSLKAADFSKGALATLKGAPGATGAAGATGPRGEAGAPGAPGGGGSESGREPTVTGADGTVAGTLIHSAHVNNGVYSYQVRTPTGLIVTYLAEPGRDQWELFGNDIFVLSLASDCSEPRYIQPDVARSFPRGNSVVFHRDRWDWDFTIGTQRITPAGNANVYWLQGDGTCAPLGTIGDNSPALAELIRLEPTPVPIPVLTTPVTIG
jgi:hypothetical protein